MWGDGRACVGGQWDEDVCICGDRERADGYISGLR